ncbi:MAG TPA: RNA polymerase sigma factor RpoD/SigA [Fibrobacteria bacterium]|nr:RNA polymerase sigma factor RpoD/SigA [Fibrobacteria bacterium]
MHNTHSRKSAFLQDTDPIAAYIHDIRDSHKLTSREEKALAARIRQGDRNAIRKLAEANLKFVIAVARQYENRGLPLIDLISEGNLGLLRAAARFDETQDCRFISYAVWWIRQALVTALADQTRAFRLTTTVTAKLQRINRASQSLAQKLGREPSAEELELETGIHSGSIRTYMRLMPSTLSLNAEQDGGAGEFQDALAEDPDSGTEARMDRFLTKRAVDKVIRGLDKREREILRLFFGLDAGPAMNLAQLARRFGMSKERVRQIKGKAMAKLKSFLRRTAKYPCIAQGGAGLWAVP